MSGPSPASAVPRDGRRLWSSLAEPPVRTSPPKGADVFGAWVRGVAARQRGARGLRSIAERVLQGSEQYRNASDGVLASSAGELRDHVLVEGVDRLTADAFALGVEAVRRVFGFTLHAEQVMGALAMARGACCEMATGEGKTVTAVLPATLWGWLGRGVHVLTVNDYLATRDAGLTRDVYRMMGLSVGVITQDLGTDERRAAYGCGVTYSSEKQAVFDFLRDRLVTPVNPRLTGLLLDEFGGRPRGVEQDLGRRGWQRLIVQRGHHFAIIDEADSVLIDEAVTPAVVSAETGGAVGSHFRTADTIARSMERGSDYEVDHRNHRVRLTDAGQKRLETTTQDLDAFWSGPRRREEIVVRALTAHELYTLDDDYIVRDEEDPATGETRPSVVIVDRSTGRVLPGRQWQQGLHQAVEAKEGLEVSGERGTSSRVSYQRYFQRYRRLAGMSGTVWEVRSELWRTYELPVVRIPTHKPVIRTRARDRICSGQDRKFELVADRVKEHHAKGRPVLVGTRSVASSERLGALLAERGIECRILNALREAEEATVIAEAGRPGAATVATNMAGRGTDILLSDASRDAGGLVVIATERHDESRVDRQLFGRSGRQGDPGLAECFVSLDDRLIERHGPKWLVAIARNAALRGVVSPLLWWSSQRAASERYAVARTETAKADAAGEVAMPMHGR